MKKKLSRSTRVFKAKILQKKDICKAAKAKKLKILKSNNLIHSRLLIIFDVIRGTYA